MSIRIITITWVCNNSVTSHKRTHARMHAQTLTHTHSQIIPVHQTGTPSRCRMNPPGYGTSDLQEGCACPKDDGMGTQSPT